MKLGHIELFVRDPLAARRFYTQALDFELVLEQGEAFTWLKSGETELLLRPGEPPPAAESYARTNIGFVMYTSDLAGALDRLQQHGIACQPMPGEPGCYMFTDLDGNWFQLVNPADHSG